MNIDLLIIKQDFKLHDVVQKTNKGLLRGRETYRTKQIQANLALYDKGQTKTIKTATASKTLSIIEGYAHPEAIKIDDVITSFSSSHFRVLSTQKINDSILFLKAIFHDVQPNS